MLSKRQKKRPGGTWYVRGTVQIGQATQDVEEHSSGTADAALAETYRSMLQTKIERDLLYGAPAQARRVEWDDAALAWAETGLNMSETSRLGILNAEFKGTVLNDLTLDDWDQFVRGRLPGRARNTINNYRKAFNNVFKLGGVLRLGIPSTKEDIQKNTYLPIDDANRLLAAYTAWAHPAALLARYQGMRAGEIVRLARRDVDLSRGFLEIRNAKGKKGLGRRLPIHPACAETLVDLFKQTASLDDPLICGYDGAVLKDPRETGHNPWDGSHRGACKRAGIESFTFHDWRHHWATWFLIEGGDPRSLQALGGWSKLEMVQIYTTVDIEHARKLQARMA